jgi:hypothetical protein
MGAGHRRILALFTAGVALQFVLGSVFTELWPLKAVLQYQPHRSWRFLALLLRAAAATGVVAGYRAGGMSRAAAVVTGIVLVVPGLEPLLPVAVVLQAVWGYPPPAAWARLSAAFVLLAVSGWNDREPSIAYLTDLAPRATGDLALACAAAAIALFAAREAPARWRSPVLAAAALLVAAWLAPRAYRAHQARWDSGSWRAVQDWARASTPRSAVFLTPPREAGFRVFSERTIVGEWKDGTQQYFDDAFVREWGARMEAVGEDLAPLPEDRLVELAHRYGATYIVLPRGTRKALPDVYRNPSWVVYKVPAS